jgi:hypothetical protein
MNRDAPIGKVHPASLEMEVRQLFKGFAEALPPDSATLTIVEDPRPGEGLTLSLTPSSPTAAQISVRVDNACEVTLSFGEGSIYEVPTRGRRYTDAPFLEEVRLLCSAVIEGRFTETIWLKGAEVVQTRGEVRIGDKVIPHFWRQLFTNPFRRRRMKTISYSPFVVQPGNSHAASH